MTTTTTPTKLLPKGEILVAAGEKEWSRDHFTGEKESCPVAAEAGAGKVGVRVVMTLLEVHPDLADMSSVHRIPGMPRSVRSVSYMVCPHCGRDGRAPIPMPPSAGEGEIVPWGVA